MTTATPIKLRIPKQDLAQFTGFELSVEGATAWAQALPVTNTRQVTQQLRETLTLLNRTALAPDLRFEIMEALRPNLKVALSTLNKRILNQPLAMPEEPRQLAELGSALYSLAASAYTVAAIEAIQQRDAITHASPAQLVTESLQRAVVFAGLRLLQTYQLYQDVEDNGWLELHQLYALAERQQLARLPVVDSLFGDSSVHQAYLRAVVLGCCKPNQLRQGDLTGVYRALQQWREHLELHEAARGQGLFQIDLESDRPPIYSALYSAAPTPTQRGIDTSSLVAHLEALREQDDKQGKPGIVLDRDTTLPSNLLEHLIGVLGTVTKRNFARAGVSDTLAIALGLSNTHYFIAGELTFDQLLYGAMNDEFERPQNNPFINPERQHDSWEDANPHEDGLREAPNHDGSEVMVDEATMAKLDNIPTREPARERHRAHNVTIVNAGPGGYCLEWSPDLPGDVRAGDIVCVRDGEAADWVVAVTRWVSQLKNARTLIGVELMSPTAMPYGARVLQTSGEETELMRVLLLPEIQLVGQPHTLVTPRTGFKERQRLTLVREGEQFYVELTRQVSATAAFAQFDFRYIKVLEDVIAEDSSTAMSAAYDSLWTKI